MRVLLTTDAGLEDVAAAELAEIVPQAVVRRAPHDSAGMVYAEAAEVDGLRHLSTIHHVYEVRGEAEVRTLDDVRSAVAGFEFPEFPEASSFRVSADRRGEHRFTRLDLERAAGGVLHARHGTPVDLDEPEIDVRVHLRGAWLTCGLRLTSESLGNRIRRGGLVRSALRPTVAAAMLRIVGAHRGPGKLLDPLCGSGTIPVEAKRLNPLLAVSASDWDPATVGIARRTVANHALEIDVREADARSLPAVYADRFDYIVTDPPYGVRQARRSIGSRLYASLLPSFEQVLASSGKIAVIVLKYAAFTSALRRTALSISHERLIELGRLSARLLILH